MQNTKPLYQLVCSNEQGQIFTFTNQENNSNYFDLEYFSLNDNAEADIKICLVSDIDISKFKGSFANFIIETNNIKKEYKVIITEIVALTGLWHILCKSPIIQLNQPFNKVFSKTCRAEFCDNKCKISISSVSEQVEVISIDNGKIEVSTSKNDDYFTGGIFLYKDKRFRILKHQAKIITTSSLPDDIKVGDIIILQPVCDKKFTTCIKKYNNAINFRGEPHIPGEKILKSL